MIDIAAPGLLIRQNGQERNVPPSEVAQIDFAGDGRSPAGVGGQPRILLRNGQTVDGRLWISAGTQPKILYVDTPSGQRQFNSDEVALVVLNPTGAAAPGGRAPIAWPGTAGTVGRRQTTTFTVPGNQQWIETDVNVRDGETLDFRVSGEIEYAPNTRVNRGRRAARRTPGGPDVPMPNAPAGALIGRIDNGQPFLIGRNTVGAHAGERHAVPRRSTTTTSPTTAATSASSSRGKIRLGLGTRCSARRTSSSPSPESRLQPRPEPRARYNSDAHPRCRIPARAL